MTTSNIPTPDPNIQNPDNDLQNFIQQWEQQQAQAALDSQQLATLITQMLALAKSGKTEEAFQVAEMGVMPQAMTVQGDGMGGLAGAMNIGSACQEFTTDAQNQVNNGTTITPAQAQQFITDLKQLYDAVQAEMNLPPNKQHWMDPNTAQGILNSLTKISGEFEVGSNPDSLAAMPGIGFIVASDIQQWTLQPNAINSGMDGNAPAITGQQHMQNIQAGFQQWNNTESAQSQSLTAQEQFAANTFNQYMNACKGIFQAMQQQAQNFVQNQKTS